jgi:signal transduction histidine kinase/phage shock protein PspC (stress-responsive transcriptional regulator)
VAVGLAAHLGLPVRVVRIGFVVAAIAGGGAGLLLYGWLWALVPTSEHPPTAADPLPGVPRLSQARLGDILLGGLLLFAGLTLAGARFGWDVNPRLLLPAVVVIGGAVLAYSQLDEVERSRAIESATGHTTERTADRAGVQTRAALLRVVGGLVLVLAGVLLVVVRSTDLAYAGRVLVAVVAVLGGAGLVLAPWGLRLWRDLDTERTARVREAERADIAAHLHDSVLQTLALIQRSASDPAQVARLARAQERDLREWLYGARTGGDASGVGEVGLAAEVKAAAAELEDLLGIAIDVVVVGDRRLDDRGAALVRALREAASNAVRHAGAPVSVYVEAGPGGVEAFVRDRGPGFDLAAVPADRLGVRESIVGRMQRHRGTATIRSVPGEGTEVKLVMPEQIPQEQTQQEQPQQEQTQQEEENR